MVLSSSIELLFFLFAFYSVADNQFVHANKSQMNKHKHMSPFFHDSRKKVTTEFIHMFVFDRQHQTHGSKVDGLMTHSSSFSVICDMALIDIVS